MQIELSGHHVEVTEALRSYVHDKLRRLEHHFDPIIDAEVVLEVEKLQHKAEATVRLGGGGSRVFADAVAEDMYAAIDALVDKLDRQVLKHKEKAVDQRRHGASLKTSP
ncbi:ribosome hibernation-promoting factor, HPF/YfiA family [Halorhodospira neutriphila]|uniref:Ribosome hibernation promoting factor n=1 Tax=Halorhodospira neutriphila TaxID=168379 RepID=A0ABS1E476_9GAMM|nr:ribosome-associated translation inhibitor RaiA [Halorhodospira neutriphila]MBK1726540.1 ribosomal subunit interface protein [Halorhodospira neutriphila]